MSPPSKMGALIEPIAEMGVAEASLTGGALTYLANVPIESDPQGFSNSAQILDPGPARMDLTEHHCAQR